MLFRLRVVTDLLCFVVLCGWLCLWLMWYCLVCVLVWVDCGFLGSTALNGVLQYRFAAFCLVFGFSWGWNLFVCVLILAVQFRLASFWFRVGAVL